MGARVLAQNVSSAGFLGAGVAQTPTGPGAGVGGPSLGHWGSEMWLGQQRTRRAGSGSVGGPASWLSSVRFLGASMQFLEGTAGGAGLMGSSLRNRTQNPTRVTWSEVGSESQKVVRLWRCRGTRDPEWRAPAVQGAPGSPVRGGAGRRWWQWRAPHLGIRGAQMSRTALATSVCPPSPAGVPGGFSLTPRVLTLCRRCSVCCAELPSVATV